MELLLTLLERKNLCFRSFHKICTDFLDEISKGEVSNLDEFQKRRQGLINVLEQLEFEIGHLLESMNSNPALALATERADAETKRKIETYLTEKNSLVKSILDLDLIILSHVDRIKDDTIKKLQALQSSRRTIGAYKSPLEQVETAEMAKTFDREA